MESTGSLAASALHAAAEGLRLETLVAENAATLADVGVETIVLKGVSFARLLYPEGGRVSGDVDLLVQHSDVARASTALEAHGFVLRPPAERLPMATDAAIGFARPGKGGVECFIDLHWNMHGSLTTPEHTWRVLSANTRELDVAGRPVRVLSPAGCALHVALHAARSGLGGKRREDLRRAVRRLPPRVWARAAVLARELELEDAFAAGVRLIPIGVELADRLELTTTRPDPWRFPCAWPVHGSERVRVVLVRRSPREAARLVRTALFPGKDRVLREARSPRARRSVLAAYLDHWRRLARDVPRAFRTGWAQSRIGR